MGAEEVGVEDGRATYWQDAISRNIPLGNVSKEEVERAPEERADPFFIAGMVLAARGGEDLSDEQVHQSEDVVRENLLHEGLRRRFAKNRPKLFCLRDLPLLELDRRMEIPEREFMLGLAYMIREKTGRELTAEQAASEIDYRLTGGNN
jgi:exopolyphosphatase/pppGpp-phosphohydrolase